MLYYEFNTNDKAYKLRLNTRNIIELEKKLGQNPITIFFGSNKISTKDKKEEEEFNVPSVTTMVYILHYSLQQYQHNITLNDSYDIFDKWLDEEHTVMDFLPIITEVFKVSGIFTEGKADEKN